MAKRSFIYISSNIDRPSDHQDKFQGRSGGPFDDEQAKVSANAIGAHCIFDFSQEMFDILIKTKRVMYPRDVVPSWMINKIHCHNNYGDIFS